MESLESLEKELGEQVRRLRLRQDITQAELAQRAGIHLNTVSMLERGRGSSLGTLVAVLDVLGASGWLLTLAPEPSVSPVALLRGERTDPRRRATSRAVPGGGRGQGRPARGERSTT